MTKKLTFIWASVKLGLFGFVLGLYWVCIGFVFRESPEGLILVILCDSRTCVHFAYFEIGFVLHKRADL